jgi:predicted CXXCH cytochrome family protein
MRRFLQMAAMAATLIGAAAYAGIAGSKHDIPGTWTALGFSGTAPTDEICKYCHTPHNADMNMVSVPLWNHQTTAATFTVYTSSTLDATPGQPTGVSKACLSCHDGTVSIDSYTGHIVNNAATKLTAANPGFLDTDLRNDHPISFTFDAALATKDGTLFTPASATCVDTSSPCQVPLYSGQVECASCHAVHGSGAVPKFLRMSNTGSALCLKCHNK